MWLFSELVIVKNNELASQDWEQQKLNQIFSYLTLIAFNRISEVI